MPKKLDLPQGYILIHRFIDGLHMNYSLYTDYDTIKSAIKNRIISGAKIFKNRIIIPEREIEMYYAHNMGYPVEGVLALRKISANLEKANYSLLEASDRLEKSPSKADIKIRNAAASGIKHWVSIKGKLLNLLETKPESAELKNFIEKYLGPSTKRRRKRSYMPPAESHNKQRQRRLRQIRYRV